MAPAPRPVERRRVDRLEVETYRASAPAAAAAARAAADALRRAVERRGSASAMFATGNSQLEFIAALVGEDGVPWHRVVVFHMDEYLGVGPDHPAGFQRWIRQRLSERVRPATAHYLDGLADPAAESARYGALLQAHPLDLCCLGIGENGHLAFNDPPVARFDDPETVKVVTLDLACRRQQVGEGHFGTLAQVPARALTVTVPALLAAPRVLAVVPEGRKAEPVRQALQGPVVTACPASALRTASGRATLYLDPDSARLLGPR